MDATEHSFNLLDCTVFPSRNVIAGPRGEQHIEPKAMRVLLLLVEQQNDVISRQYLLDTVWPETYSGEEALTRAISLLRASFGENKQDRRFIETVSKSGYRLITPVVSTATAASSNKAQTIQALLPMPLRSAILFAVLLIAFAGFLNWNSKPDTPEVNSQVISSATLEQWEPNDFSIAVLPLANLSPDPDNAYFAAGIHEEILNQLVKVSQLEVKSRNSVLRFEKSELSNQEIALELNVSTIMEGSVRFSGNQVSITTQLIRASDDVHLWSETYQREYEDIFAIQSSVAIEVANAMHASLTSSELADIEKPPTDSTQAYSLYLQAIAIERSSDEKTEGLAMFRTVPLLERAIELDPSFARAYATLAIRKQLVANGFPLSARRSALEDDALRHANLAIELDPNQAEAYLVLSRYYWSQKQWDLWLLNARLSVELPSQGTDAALSLAIDLSEIGQHEAAYHWTNRAISIEPEDSALYLYAAHMRVAGGDYESSLVFLDQYLALGGRKDDYHTLRALALHFLDRDDEFRNELKQLAGRAFSLELYGVHEYLHCQTPAREQILQEANALPKPSVSGYIGRLFCALGSSDLDTVFSLLYPAMQKNLRVRPRLRMYDEAKLDPRWQAVQEYMDLPELSADQIPY